LLIEGCFHLDGTWKGEVVSGTALIADLLKEKEQKEWGEGLSD